MPRLTILFVLNIVTSIVISVGALYSRSTRGRRLKGPARSGSGAEAGGFKIRSEMIEKLEFQENSFHYCKKLLELFRENFAENIEKLHVSI